MAKQYNPLPGWPTLPQGGSQPGDEGPEPSWSSPFDGWRFRVAREGLPRLSRKYIGAGVLVGLIGAVTAGSAIAADEFGRRSLALPVSSFQTPISALGSRPQAPATPATGRRAAGSGVAAGARLAGNARPPRHKATKAAPVVPTNRTTTNRTTTTRTAQPVVAAAGRHAAPAVKPQVVAAAAATGSATTAGTLNRPTVTAAVSGHHSGHHHHGIGGNETGVYLEVIGVQDANAAHRTSGVHHADAVHHVNGLHHAHGSHHARSFHQDGATLHYSEISFRYSGADTRDHSGDGLNQSGTGFNQGGSGAYGQVRLGPRHRAFGSPDSAQPQYAQAFHHSGRHCL